MSTAPKRKTSRERVRAYRAKLRARGLRPIQIWVPDIDSPEFVAEAHRQSLALANSPTEKEDQAWVDSVTDPDALYEAEDE